MKAIIKSTDKCMFNRLQLQKGFSNLLVWHTEKGQSSKSVFCVRLRRVVTSDGKLCLTQRNMKQLPSSFMCPTLMFFFPPLMGVILYLCPPLCLGKTTNASVHPAAVPSLTGPYKSIADCSELGSFLFTPSHSAKWSGIRGGGRCVGLGGGNERK